MTLKQPFSAFLPIMTFTALAMLASPAHADRNRARCKVAQVAVHDAGQPNERVAIECNPLLPGLGAQNLQAVQWVVVPTRVASGKYESLANRLATAAQTSMLERNQLWIEYEQYPNDNMQPFIAPGCVVSNCRTPWSWGLSSVVSPAATDTKN